jgi:hypothetical protein
MIRVATAVVALLFTAEVKSETIDVKYWGPLDLKTFECRDISRSSFIQRVCYDRAQSLMVISLKGVYYPYCELPQAALESFMVAPSMGQFYNENIKGTGSDGPYDCRTQSAAQLLADR